MKASTLFIISIAVLVALGAMAGAKYIGLFDRKPVVVDSKAKDEQILVLVANSDLHKGVAITANDVRIRELQPGERDFYEANRGKFLPPNLQAAHLRTPADRVKADTPLRRTDFVEDQPEPLSARLDKGMRSVTLVVPKERCDGGLIQMGEYVDVLLTTKISDPAIAGRTFERTAQIARECRVIAKRNNLRTVQQSDPDGAGIAYQIEVNPYRAALIEYAKNRGQITLVLNPTENSRPLDPLPRGDSRMGMAQSFSDMNSKEYADEQMRVEAMKKGEMAVGDSDLVRIFQVEPPAPKIPPITVTRITGINRSSQYVFPRGGDQSDAGGSLMPIGNLRAGVADFSAPDNSKPGDCPTCGKNNPQAQATAPIMVPGTSTTFSPPR
jgi:Flp pilus assembly protein CpaB